MSWTDAETNKFLELLEKYPAEKSEANRWRKIAKELGTKTEKQIKSKEWFY